jgi:hypothetical protein
MGIAEAAPRLYVDEDILLCGRTRLVLLFVVVVVFEASHLRCRETPLAAVTEDCILAIGYDQQ